MENVIIDDMHCVLRVFDRIINKLQAQLTIRNQQHLLISQIQHILKRQVKLDT
jgi:hypothetical protein